MKQNRSLQLAYLAGVIDSDGCIAILRHQARESNQSIRPTYDLKIIINQADGGAINYIRGIYGGTVTSQFSYAGTIIYTWRLNHEKSGELCKQLIPYLRIKKKQAEIAVQFWYYKQKCESIRKFLMAKHSDGFDSIGRRKPIRSFSDEQLAKMHELHLKIRELKTTYIVCAGAETKQLRPVNTVSDSPQV
jgi:hypothetical protein